MKPNILFILVDGLRADQVYSKNKTSHTPFFDSLISEGVYFDKMISSSDGTTISLNCTLNSKFQFETGIRAKKIKLLENNHLETIRNAGYHMVGIAPNLSSLKPLTDFFQNDDKLFEPGPPPETLPTGMENRIKLLLNSLEDNQPWFCYLHLFDLHPLREGRKSENIDEFKTEKYGNNLYSQTVSSIDFWLKSALSDVNFDNTLLIITADHGERIPFDEKQLVDFEPELETISKLGKKLLPNSTHKIGGKILGNIKGKLGKEKLRQSNEGLSSYQKRSRDPYFTLSLYDELIHVPFLLKGLNTSSEIFSKQVSTLSIFPTIFDIVKIPQKDYHKKKSLFPLLKNKENWNENEIYLHTSPYEKESKLDRIGIRTEKYKFFHHARNPEENVHLYDLENDPYENNNIFEIKLELVKKMEKILNRMQENILESNNDITKEEEEEISKELKKLGYL